MLVRAERPPSGPLVPKHETRAPLRHLTNTGGFHGICRVACETDNFGIPTDG